MAINVTDLNNRCVTTSTVGYMALALTALDAVDDCRRLV